MSVRRRSRTVACLGVTLAAAVGAAASEGAAGWQAQPMYDLGTPTGIGVDRSGSWMASLTTRTLEAAGSPDIRTLAGFGTAGKKGPVARLGTWSDETVLKVVTTAAGDAIAIGYHPASQSLWASRRHNGIWSSPRERVVPGEFWIPEFGAGEQGHVTVAWTTTNGGVQVARFSAVRDVWTPVQRLAPEGGRVTSARVATNAFGDTAVSWVENSPTRATMRVATSSPSRPWAAGLAFRVKPASGAALAVTRRGTTIAVGECITTLCTARRTTPFGAWTPLKAIPGTAPAESPRIGVRGDGAATVAWRERGYRYLATSSASATGVWSPPMRVPGAAGRASEYGVGVGPLGDDIVAFSTFNPPGTVQIASRTPKGWSKGVVVGKTSEYGSDAPLSVAMNGAADAIVTWNWIVSNGIQPVSAATRKGPAKPVITSARLASKTTVRLGVNRAGRVLVEMTPPGAVRPARSTVVLVRPGVNVLKLPLRPRDRVTFDTGNHSTVAGTRALRVPR